ncbi:MAG: hypothetical protein P4L57_01245 [Rhizomicrobium sp.]|nr:hypothetical protein [Rhizomicrobium sp.]
MSQLVGTYKNENIGATLAITQANDSNGQITAASVSYGGQTYPATGHYHFKNSGGPTTCVTINAMNDSLGYISLALTAPDMQFKELKSFGGFVTFDAVAVGLGGAFMRQ